MAERFNQSSTTEPSPGQVGATELATTGAPVSSATAAPPVVGQVATATSATTYEWQAALDADAIHGNISGEISALTLVTVDGADHILIEDASDTNNKKRIAASDLLGAATDADAIHDNVAGEIAAIAAKSPVAAGDFLLIEDSAAANAKKSITVADLRITESQITDLMHTDATAIHDNVASEISAITEKITPVAADLLLIEDSADTNNKKRIQVGNLPAGSTTFTALTDTPANFTGASLQSVRVNSGESALEFHTPSGGLWHPDQPPLVSSSFDDEFIQDGALSVLWSVLDNGANITGTTAANGRLKITKSDHSGSVDVAGIYQAVPVATDYTITAAIAVNRDPGSMSVGLFLAEDLDASPTTANITEWAISLGGDTIYRQDRTAYNATGSPGATDSLFAATSIYLRLRVSGTTINYDYSWDGHGWFELSSGTGGLSSINHMGVFVDNRTGSTQSIFLRWFRVVEGTSAIDQAPIGGYVRF